MTATTKPMTKRQALAKATAKFGRQAGVVVENTGAPAPEARRAAHEMLKTIREERAALGDAPAATRGDPTYADRLINWREARAALVQREQQARGVALQPPRCEIGKVIPAIGVYIVGTGETWDEAWAKVEAR